MSMPGTSLPRRQCRYCRGKEPPNETNAESLPGTPRPGHQSGYIPDQEPGGFDIAELSPGIAPQRMSPTTQSARRFGNEDSKRAEKRVSSAAATSLNSQTPP